MCDPKWAAQAISSLSDTAYDIVSADFNADGRVDAVAVSVNEGAVVYTNTGAGTFSSSSLPSVLNGARGVAVGHLNADSFPDIAVAFTDSSAVVAFINNGDGTFTPNAVGGVFTGAHGIAIANLDRAGFDDIVVTGASGNSVSVAYTSDDEGTTVFTTTTIDSAATGAFDVAVANFNRAGGLDIAVTLRDANEVVVYVNNGGQGDFTRTSIATAQQPRGIAAADFDNDGFVDLATADTGSAALAVHYNDGDMSFSSQLFSTGILADVYRVHATDIDLDCDQDIVVSVTGANAVVLYENTDPEVRGSLTFTAVSSGAPGVRGIATGDVDNDGDIDVFAGAGGSVDFVYYKSDCCVLAQ